MNRLPMSPAGASLLRALLSRTGIQRNRILLTNYRSIDWQSLTFVGERHEMQFRITGPGAEETYRAITGDFADSELSISKQILADIAVYGKPTRNSDGSLTFGIEALTIEE